MVESKDHVIESLDRASSVTIELITDNVVALSGIKDQSFDFVFDGHLVHCLVGADRGILLANAHRVLKPDGFFIVRSIVWPVESKGGVIVDPETKIGYLGDVPYRYYPEADELIEEVRSAKFEILHWEYTVTLEDGYGFQHVEIQCRRA